MNTLFFAKKLSQGLILASCLLIVQLSFAQTEHLTETSLPLKFDTGNPSPDGCPSTSISIQGKSLPLMVDTGMKKQALVLTPQAIKNLKVQFTGKETCSHTIYGKYC